MPITDLGRPGPQDAKSVMGIKNGALRSPLVAIVTFRPSGGNFCKMVSDADHRFEVQGPSPTQKNLKNEKKKTRTRTRLYYLTFYGSAPITYFSGFFGLGWAGLGPRMPNLRPASKTILQKFPPEGQDLQLPLEGSGVLHFLCRSQILVPGSKVRI